MTSCRWTLALILAGMVVLSAPAIGARELQDEEDQPRALSPKDQALKFLQGLRERAYYDLALDYIGQLRKATDTPADLRAVLDYEEGRGLLDEASRMADLERRAEQLD